MFRQWLTTLLALGVGAVILIVVWQPGATGCEVCHRPLHRATSYVIQTDSGDQVDVCCPRCGLHYQVGRDDIVDVQVADFTTGSLVDAARATYVEGSEVHLCCLTPEVREDRSGSQYDLAWDRCMPSLVAFQSLQDALEFQGKNGGSLRSYADLLAEEQASLPASR